jgi:Phytanoyl-CoA dioxygenase (PhyH)
MRVIDEQSPRVGYTRRMNSFFDDIVSYRGLCPDSTQQLIESGFTIIPGPILSSKLPKLSSAYDEAMGSASGADFNVGSTTTRLYDLVNRGSAFDEIYTYPALLEACLLVIREPFKLSSLLGRTLRPGTAAQELHVDLKRGSTDSPMVGFIFMVDAFSLENGATRFIPSSRCWKDAPSDRLFDTRAAYAGEVAACGDAGSLIVFDGAVWHGHAANNTREQRRSMQGYFVRRAAQSGIDFAARMNLETRRRISPLAQYLLSL